MARQKYAMNPGEKIVYKTSQVRHGFGDQYKHTLTITNQSVILEKYGLFNQFRGIEQFDYSHIRQAVVGKSPSGRNDWNDISAITSRPSPCNPPTKPN